VKRFNLYFLFICLPFNLIAQEITLNGVYRGSNIFVQNPYLNAEGAYCIAFVMVNGIKVIDDPSVSAVKIDLTGFAINDTISIVVHHHASCTPKILNPDVLDIGSAFEYLQITADDAAISWVTTGEMPGNGYYFIEKLKLDGWVAIDTIRGKGKLDNNQYSKGIEHYSGENQFKLLYIYNGDTLESNEFSFYSDLDIITLDPEDEDVYDWLYLSRKTDYVIKDDKGEILLKGYGEDINVEKLPFDELTIIIENREETFYHAKQELIIVPKKKKGKKKELR